MFPAEIGFTFDNYFYIRPQIKVSRDRMLCENETKYGIDLESDTKIEIKNQRPR